jgi:hypothetical protein
MVTCPYHSQIGLLNFLLATVPGAVLVLCYYEEIFYHRQPWCFKEECKEKGMFNLRNITYCKGRVGKLFTMRILPE